MVGAEACEEVFPCQLVPAGHVARRDDLVLIILEVRDFPLCAVGGRKLLDVPCMGRPSLLTRPREEMIKLRLLPLPATAVAGEAEQGLDLWVTGGTDLSAS